MGRPIRVRFGFCPKSTVHRRTLLISAVFGLLAACGRRKVRARRSEFSEPSNPINFAVQTHWGPHQFGDLMGKAGAAERLSFRACPEAKDTQLATASRRDRRKTYCTAIGRKDERRRRACASRLHSAEFAQDMA